MDTPRLDDRELVAQARSGDEAALRELIRRFERPVFSLIFRLVRHRETAEDLAQEAFVKAFQNLDRFDPRYKVSSWIFKIAHNHAIDHLRRRRVDTLSIHGSPYALDAEEARESELAVAAPGASPEAAYEARELGSAIEQAIGRLRPAYRTAVLLRHVEGRAYEEIAEIMDLPIGTVKTYLHRARAELKAMLGHLRE
ncbi:MAG: sigma-70 family RNA polymerase sigma factor [Gemmatimonadetes bacterium]|nr:sigma-70 family RNA polymerase sigma factor [Gemmatimonadota bacterium]